MTPAKLGFHLSGVLSALSLIEIFRGNYGNIFTFILFALMAWVFYREKEEEEDDD